MPGPWRATPTACLSHAEEPQVGNQESTTSTVPSVLAELARSGVNRLPGVMTVALDGPMASVGLQRTSSTALEASWRPVLAATAMLVSVRAWPIRAAHGHRAFSLRVSERITESTPLILGIHERYARGFKVTEVAGCYLHPMNEGDCRYLAIRHVEAPALALRLGRNLAVNPSCAFVERDNAATKVIACHFPGSAEARLPTASR